MAKNPHETQPKSNQPGQYFEERKKGQMNELKKQYIGLDSLLNKVINQQDSKKGRDVVRKVIGYMTLGMDASPVFSQMCRASFTNDQVMKKMIYFYLTTYAEDNPELTIMAINTFQKDCKHSSSKIRGLALRNLCSFKSADYVNNVLPIIRQLLTDFQPYVKKTAIMGLLKVFYYDPETIFHDEGIISTLSSLIRDGDPLVSCNAVAALDEIFISEGGIPLSPKLVKYLYNRLKQYNEWEQTQILQILSKYVPNTEQEHFEIMSILWDKLKLSSTSLVLGSVRIIIKLSKDKPDLFKKVVEKIKAPLITLMSSKETTGSFETAFIILQHIEYTIRNMNGKAFYEKDFKYFYCKIDEPTYVKSIKVRILGMLANEFNLGDMLNELNEYALGNDLQIARQSVEILADIALSLPDVSKALMVNLTSFYKGQKPHLINESLRAFYKVLKRYPKLFSQIRGALLQNRNYINEPEAIKSFIWILGTFSAQIDASPYILQQYIQNEDQFMKQPDSLKSVLLTQIIQTFLKRPPETHRILGKIFKYIFHGDEISMVLKDHASFYYRALKDNAEEVRRGFSIIEGDSAKSKDQLQQANAEDDFNNLSMVYKKKQNKFIKNYQYFISMRNKELGLIEPNNLPEEQEQEMIPHQPHQPFNFKEQPPKTIDWSQPLEATDLQNDITMTAQQFQQIWNSLPSYQQRQYKSLNEQYLDEESVQQLFKMWSLHTMASASEDDQKLLKFFIYSRHTTDRFMCLEVNVDKNQKLITLLTKAQETEMAHLINDYIGSFLRTNQFIQ